MFECFEVKINKLLLGREQVPYNAKLKTVKSCNRRDFEAWTKKQLANIQRGKEE